MLALLSFLSLILVFIVCYYVFVWYPSELQSHASKLHCHGKPVPSSGSRTHLSDALSQNDPSWFLKMMERYLDIGMFQSSIVWLWPVRFFRPDFAAAIYTKPDDRYDRDVSTLGILADFFGRSILGVSGEDWKRQHKIVSRAFTTVNINRFFPIFMDLLQNTVVPFIELEMKKNGSVQMEDIFRTVAIEFMIRAGFAADKKQTQEVKQLFETCSNNLSNPLFMIPFYRKLNFIPHVKAYNMAIKRLKEITQMLVVERRKVNTDQQRNNKDDQTIKYLIDLILEADEEETKLTPQEVQDNVLVFLRAGSESTAISMLWFLHNILAYDLKIYERLRKEIDQVVPEDPNQLTLQHLSSLSYFHRVLDESIRLCPTVVETPSRILKEDTQVGEWTAEKGCQLSLNIFLTHHSPKNWEDPERFDPDRCETPDLGEEEKISSQQYKFVPFGAGRRVCLGKGLALLEMRVVLCYLLRRFNFSVPSSEKLPKERKIRFPQLYPSGGLRLIVEPRTNKV